MNEELDIVKSLELTAEGSYDEGYRKGWKEGIDEMWEACIRRPERTRRGFFGFAITMSRRLHNQTLRTEAERLKEQG